MKFPTGAEQDHYIEQGPGDAGPQQTEHALPPRESEPEHEEDDSKLRDLGVIDNVHALMRRQQLAANPHGKIQGQNAALPAQQHDKLTLQIGRNCEQTGEQRRRRQANQQDNQPLRQEHQPTGPHQTAVGVAISLVFVVNHMPRD